MTTELSAHDCLTERRKRLRQAPNVFGLDFVELCSSQDHDSPHRKFRLHFLGSRPEWLTKGEQVVLRDCRNGHRPPVELVATPGKQIPGSGVEVEVLSAVCDDVEYSLTLDVPAGASPSLDPFFACVTFRLNPQGPAKVDCVPTHDAEVPTAEPPDINYLAKDYATFRQLMLDRLSVTMPDWQERCPADIGLMLVEILAYAADHLSYYQDAVATEAYLGTARLRQSLRRHARLVDYRVHEGCNARAWVHLEVSDAVNTVTIQNAKDLFFVSAPRGAASSSGSALTKDSLDKVLREHSGCAVFEPVVSKSFKFWQSHNECRIHDWGRAIPCLPRGATSAYLVNQAARNVAAVAEAKRAQDQGPDDKTERPGETDWLQFRPGDVLVLEEILSPWTGTSADADPSHRHVVRITNVDYDHRDDLHHNQGKLCSLPLVKITWDEADALPFTLWISKPPDADWADTNGASLSVARGNILLVDHGRSLLDDEVRFNKAWQEPGGPRNVHYPAAGVKATLAAPNLTFSDGLPSSGAPAAAQLRQEPRQATPQVVLHGKSPQRKVDGEFSILELRDLRRIARRLLWDRDSQSADAHGAHGAMESVPPASSVPVATRCKLNMPVDATLKQHIRISSWISPNSVTRSGMTCATSGSRNMISSTAVPTTPTLLSKCQTNGRRR